ncbi:hypothetical protein ACLB2K_003101 [Fragaria x ananassa]
MEFQLDDVGLPSLHESVQFDDSETQDVGRLFVNQPTASIENRNSGASRDWRHFDVDADLGKAWTRIEGTIDWSEADTTNKKSKIKRYALERLSDRWKHHKSDLKKLYWQVENGVEEEPDRLEIFKLIHRKKGKTNEYVDVASTKAVQDLEKAEDERRKLNVDITPEVREDIYAKVFGPEKRSRMRGLGAGVCWRDVPNIHIEKAHI